MLVKNILNFRCCFISEKMLLHMWKTDFRWFKVDSQNSSLNDRCDYCIFENYDILISVLSSLCMWEDHKRGPTFKCQVEGNKNDGKPQIYKSFRDRGSRKLPELRAIHQSDSFDLTHST